MLNRLKCAQFRLPTTLMESRGCVPIARMLLNPPDLPVLVSLPQHLLHGCGGLPVCCSQLIYLHDNQPAGHTSVLLGFFSKSPPPPPPPPFRSTSACTGLFLKEHQSSCL